VSYQVTDVTVGLSKSMNLLKPAMKGMPARQKYKREYDELRTAMAVLVMTIQDGHAYFDPDAKTAKAVRSGQAHAKKMKQNAP